MWRFTRNDAMTVWSKDIVRNRLNRYRSIIDLKLPARYLLARNIPVNFTKTDPMSKLWKIHVNTRVSFAKQLEEIKEGEIINLEKLPAQSFLEDSFGQPHSSRLLLLRAPL